jgi:NADPH:quinone reductase-like Zn-dependent oxidoreductase
MQAYQIKSGQQIAGLSLVQRTIPSLDAHDVQVRVHAVSLNYRDLMITEGKYLRTGEAPVIPCSDGAGEVIATGSAVSRLRVGDRVAASFFPEWVQGEPTPQNTAGALGGARDGMLAEKVLLHEEALVAIPGHLSYVEASTIPCAGVTAWNALFVEGKLKPGESVLLLGTGGVSVWALLIHALGIAIQRVQAGAVHVEPAPLSGQSVQVELFSGIGGGGQPVGFLEDGDPFVQVDLAPVHFV